MRRFNSKPFTQRCPNAFTDYDDLLGSKPSQGKIVFQNANRIAIHKFLDKIRETLI